MMHEFNETIDNCEFGWEGTEGEDIGCERKREKYRETYR